jgi:biofilm PGA synthesis lipoprotein PgaB
MIWLAAAMLLAMRMAGAAAQAPPAPQPMPAVPNSFTVLSYHEARDDVRDYPDPYAVDASGLVAQFGWLRANGYTPVALDDIIASRQGGKALPAKAVLLTFDDGYLSFYTRVYPLLREFGFPALLAVVGGWIDNPSGFGAETGAPPVQGSSLVPGTFLVQPPAAGQGVPMAQAAPPVAQGAPAALATPAASAAPAAYGEKASVAVASFPSWAQLREMSDSGLVEIASHSYDLHRGVLANPQGNLQPAATARIYDAATGRYEDDAGWRARVRADLARNSQAIERETDRRPRAMVWPYGSYNDELLRMAGEVGMPMAFTLADGVNTPDVPLTALRRILVEHNPTLADFAAEVRGPLFPQPVRVMQISLNAVYNADAVAQERNLSLLLDRVQLLKPTHVYLEASADLDGDGVADAAYFPTRHLPLRADLFNRVAWQLSSRDDLKVFAVLPVNGFRLAPQEIAEVYGDLARYANFDGVVFMPGEAPTAGGATRFVEVTLSLAETMRQWRGPLNTARGFAYQAMTDPAQTGQPGILAGTAAEAGYADHVLLPIRADQAVASRAAAAPPDGGRGQRSLRLVYMLESSPGAGSSSGMRLAGQMRALQSRGALNFGYRGDDFLRDDPPLAGIAPAFSLRPSPRQE